ncbi:MAG TPA: hypothetical protein VNO52_13320 [Methylomirabilota bacterium]|nr:hypothetical protein [Methylomirabilota bacterium]
MPSKRDTLQTGLRLPLLALGITALATGVWGGLSRLPLPLPLPADNANWLTFHGPLMVCGFLGTVIGLERAVGLPDKWPWLAPFLTGVGALTLVAGIMGRTGPWCLTAGSAVFLLVTCRVVHLRRELFTVTMSLGAVAWVIGNVLWLVDWPLARIVPWWIGFLALTIAGERLDLSRFQRQGPMAQPLFLTALAILLLGMGISSLHQSGGERVLGLGLLALAAWHTRFDLARRTVRQPGLPRFMAVCLLSGFAWMAAAGGLLLVTVPLQPGGTYDAALHAFFLGYVFAMIFGHAPVIFPSVLNRPIAFHGRFYGHFALLHLSLVLRSAGGLAGWPEARQWGGVLNAVALGMFLVNTIGSLAFGCATGPIEPRPGNRQPAAFRGVDDPAR